MIKNIFGYPLILLLIFCLGALNKKEWILLLLPAVGILAVFQIILAFYQKYSLRMEVKLPERVLFAGEAAAAEVFFKNTGRMPVRKVKFPAEFRCLSGKRAEKKRITVWGSVEREDTQSYEITAGALPAGLFSVSVPYARVYDYLGIFSCKIKLKRQSEILALPDFVMLPVALSGKKVFVDGEGDGMKKGQEASEIYDIRKYQPGDSLKRIYWKRSAGREILYRELFWKLPEGLRQEEIPCQIKIAGSFLYTLLGRGCLCYLVWDGGFALERRLIMSEQDILEALIEISGAFSGQKRQKKRKLLKKETKEGNWMKESRLSYQAQFSPDCPDAFFLFTEKKRRETILFFHETEMLLKVEKGTYQNEKRLEKEMMEL